MTVANVDSHRTRGEKSKTCTRKSPKPRMVNSISEMGRPMAERLGYALRISIASIRGDRFLGVGTSFILPR